MKDYTPEQQKKIFAKNLNSLIYLTGKQQKEVAKDLGMSPTTLNTWCMGKIIPNPTKLKKLCVYFKCKLTDLVDDKSQDNDKIEYIYDILTENNWECKEYSHCNENIDCPLSDDDIIDKNIHDKFFSACEKCNFSQVYFLITISVNETYKLEYDDIIDLYDKIISYIKFIIQEKVSTLNVVQKNKYDEQGMLPSYLLSNAAHDKKNASSEAKQIEERKIQEQMQKEIAKRNAMMTDTES